MMAGALIISHCEVGDASVALVWVGEASDYADAEDDSDVATDANKKKKGAYNVAGALL
ncbi:hypothetical protein [Paenibacillus contaminans]|uniref:hypothetical protein n=1 Tax=Paenibacillus contaminans TaxID=450362 RepID=UPI001314F1E2|nr:hypothetical protein [Paenibacillus contaminans]